VRLSRLLPKSSSDEEVIPLRRLVVWALVAVAIVVGLVLYFVYERQITPLVG
jgi:type VI protein secretion system component VasF